MAHQINVGQEGALDVMWSHINYQVLSSHMAHQINVGQEGAWDVMWSHIKY